MRESSSEMSEKQTREELIDKQLKKAGWLKTYVKEEVNSVRSNFKEKTFVYSEGKDDSSGRFIDYLLLAENNSPLAFIEVKRFSRSEDEGRAQARTYQADIRKQTDRTLKHFTIPAEEIRKNEYDLNISKYREIKYEEVKYEKPEVIRKNILELEQKIISTLQEIDLSA